MSENAANLLRTLFRYVEYLKDEYNKSLKDSIVFNEFQRIGGASQVKKKKINILNRKPQRR